MTLKYPSNGTSVGNSQILSRNFPLGPEVSHFNCFANPGPGAPKFEAFEAFRAFPEFSTPIRLRTPLFSEVVPERASQSWPWNFWAVLRLGDS